MLTDYSGYLNIIPCVTDLNNIKGFKLLSLNVCSLIPKINVIRSDLHSVNYHILCLNETWLKPTINDSLINIEGCNHLLVDRRVRKC